MLYKEATVALALAGLVASSVPSLALTGIGCPDLPEHERALGTIENGPGTCGMTTAEANRILARDSGQAAATQPAPRSHRKHHHRAAPRE